jgi:hypothetical protein
MSTNNEIKLLKVFLMVKKEVTPDNFKLTLTIKQIWFVCTIVVALLGSSYGVGVKLETEVKKIALLKLEREFQKQLSLKEEKEMELNRIIKEKDENCKFFENQYNIKEKHLKECMSGAIYTSEGKKIDIN